MGFKPLCPEYSLEGLMLKLKLQYFGHQMWRSDSLEKTLMLGGIEAGGEGENRGWGAWMASLTQWTQVWVNSGSWWWTGRPGVLQSMGLQRVRNDWVNWIELNKVRSLLLLKIDLKRFTKLGWFCVCIPPTELLFKNFYPASILPCEHWVESWQVGTLRLGLQITLNCYSEPH